MIMADINTQRQARRLQQLFSFMPEYFTGKKNFTALMGAIAESDSDLENLFIEVRKQLFVQTAEGSYLDKLGSNTGVTRPPLIGMIDDDFREFIKLQSYYPKQIRSLLFNLMELFYGTDTIKANTKSTVPGPYVVFDGATLNLTIDGLNSYIITFQASSFNDPSSVTPQELTAQINAQSDGTFFASTFYDAVNKLQSLQIFTDTFGPVGSIEVIGGSANRFLKFPDTMNLGATISTKYRIVVFPASTNLYWAGGDNPLFSSLIPGNYVILTGSPFTSANVGSFEIESVNDTSVPALILPTTSATFISANLVRYAMTSTSSIVQGNQVTVSGFSNASNNGTFIVIGTTGTYVDLQTTRINSSDDEVASGLVDLLPSATNISFSNPDGVTQPTFSVSSTNDVLFFKAVKDKLESEKRAATIWEINSNEIVVTLPATPIIIRRGLAGSAHLQGTSAIITKAFLGSIDIANTTYFPDISGHFYIQQPDNLIIRDTLYTYSLLNGNTLQGVTPIITPVGDKLQMGVGPLSATASSNLLLVTVTDPHLLSSGELINIKNFNGFAGLSDSDINGVRSVTSIVDNLNFYVTADNTATSTVTNAPSVDKGEIFTVRNSKVVITNVQQNTGYLGSYIFNPKNAKYTISGTQTTTTQEILLGEFGGSISVFNSGVFPETSGQVVINYGRSDEEGPVNYIAKPGVGSLFIDPSYRFKKNHLAGAAINLLSSQFATSVTTNGSDYPVYIVDTVGPRDTLENLILGAKAAGVSVRFVVTVPETVYNQYSLY